MTTDEFIVDLGKFEKRMIPAVYEAFIAKKIGFDFKSIVVQRVMMKQISGDNSKFGTYSTRTFWTTRGSFKTQGAYKKAARAASLEQKSTKKQMWATVRTSKGKNVKMFKMIGGYAELRRLENFQNRNKSFWFRGGSQSMWANFGLIDKNKSEKGARFVFGGTTPEAQNLINYNSEREGKSIIAITKNEEKELVKHIDKLIESELKKAGI